MRSSIEINLCIDRWCLLSYDDDDDDDDEVCCH